MVISLGIYPTFSDKPILSMGLARHGMVKNIEQAHHLHLRCGAHSPVRWPVQRTWRVKLHDGFTMGLSENVGCIPNEIAIFQNGIMISKTRLGTMGFSLFSDTPTMGFSHGFSSVNMGMKLMTAACFPEFFIMVHQNLGVWGSFEAFEPYFRLGRFFQRLGPPWTHWGAGNHLCLGHARKIYSKPSNHTLIQNPKPSLLIWPSTTQKEMVIYDIAFQCW